MKILSSSAKFAKSACIVTLTAACCAAIDTVARLKLTNQMVQLKQLIGKNKRSPDPTEIQLTPTIDGRTFYGRLNGASLLSQTTDSPKLHVKAYVWEKRPNDHRDNTYLKVLAEYSDPDKDAATLSFVAGSGTGSVEKFFNHYTFNEARNVVEGKLEEMKTQIGQGFMKLKALSD